MAPRLELHDLLLDLLGSECVYFQEPPNTGMGYPAIVYALDSAKTIFADGTPYVIGDRYQVTVIDSDPDSLIPGKVRLLPMCLFAQRYVANNLNHSVYNLYF